MRLVCGDDSYMVEYIGGHWSEMYWREDLVSDSDQLGRQYVIALYPHRERTYDRAVSVSVVLKVA